jgi:hypothetical protein
MAQRLTLCPQCDACPEVVIDVDAGTVRIGEAGAEVVLGREAWDGP